MDAGRHAAGVLLGVVACIVLSTCTSALIAAGLDGPTNQACAESEEALRRAVVLYETTSVQAGLCAQGMKDQCVFAAGSLDAGDAYTNVIIDHMRQFHVPSNCPPAVNSRLSGNLFLLGSKARTARSAVSLMPSVSDPKAPSPSAVQ